MEIEIDFEKLITMAEAIIDKEINQCTKREVRTKQDGCKYQQIRKSEIDKENLKRLKVVRGLLYGVRGLVLQPEKKGHS